MIGRLHPLPAAYVMYTNYPIYLYKITRDIDFIGFSLYPSIRERDLLRIDEIISRIYAALRRFFHIMRSNVFHYL